MIKVLIVKYFDKCMEEMYVKQSLARKVWTKNNEK